MRHTGVNRAVLVAVAAALVAAPALAHPPAPVDQKGRAIRGKLHTWMHQAKVPLVRGRVQIRRIQCPLNRSFAGCVIFARPRTLYLSPNLFEPRRIFYHELGHLFDLHVMNGRERRRFKRILGIRRPGWFQGGLPPSEWFADGYASCAVRLRLGRAVRPTPYGYAAGRTQHARVCRLIRSAARPRGRPPKPPRNPPRVIEVEPPPPQETQPGGEGCTLIDQLLTGCKPPPPPAAPLPASTAFDRDPDA
jgi:hypothetical protein